MKIGVELEFFICHKSDETFYMPDIISRYLNTSVPLKSGRVIN